MGGFKPAHQYDSLINFMKDRYKSKFNRGKGGITAIELKEFLTELNIPFNKSASRDKLFELLFENNVTLIQLYERFPRHYGVIKSDYVERFNLNDNEYNRLKKTGFLKKVGAIPTSSGGYMAAFDAKQFFEMSEDELRAAIPPGRNIDPEKARLAREKGLTCVRCNQVQNHYSQINKDKVCLTCQLKEHEANRIQRYVDRCREFLSDDKYVVLETATTGLDYDDEIIELAIVDMKGNTLYESLFSPAKHITAEATRLHKIDDAMLKNAPQFTDEWEKILDIVKERTVLIYNADFDDRMIRQTLKADKFLYESPFEMRCLMEFYQEYTESAYWISLADACYYADLKVNQNYRAVNDCRVILELIKAIANKKKYDGSCSC